MTIGQTRTECRNWVDEIDPPAPSLLKLCTASRISLNGFSPICCHPCAAEKQIEYNKYEIAINIILPNGQQQATGHQIQPAATGPHWAVVM